jgi:hypothetical protein
LSYNWRFASNPVSFLITSTFFGVRTFVDALSIRDFPFSIATSLAVEIADVANSLPTVLAAPIAFLPISLAAALDKFDATVLEAFDDISLLKKPEIVSKIPYPPTVCFLIYRLFFTINIFIYVIIFLIALTMIIVTLLIYMNFHLILPFALIHHI